MPGRDLRTLVSSSSLLLPSHVNGIFILTHHDIQRAHRSYTEPFLWERKKIFSVFKIIISGICHSNRKVNNPLEKEYTSRWNGTSRLMKSWDLVYEFQVLTTISKLSKIKSREFFTSKRSFTWLLACFLAETFQTRMERVIVFWVL